MSGNKKSQKEKSKMPVCLPTHETGDLPAITDPVKERVRFERLSPQPDPAGGRPPRPPSCYQPHDLIPTEVRNRLREIVLKNRDPRRALKIFQSRIPKNLAPAAAGAVRPPPPSIQEIKVFDLIPVGSGLSAPHSVDRANPAHIHEHDLQLSVIPVNSAPKSLAPAFKSLEPASPVLDSSVFESGDLAPSPASPDFTSPASRHPLLQAVFIFIALIAHQGCLL
jgi:hypothetical protein